MHQWEENQLEELQRIIAQKAPKKNETNFLQCKWNAEKSFIVGNFLKKVYEEQAFRSLPLEIAEAIWKKGAPQGSYDSMVSGEG